MGQEQTLWRGPRKKKKKKKLILRASVCCHNHFTLLSVNGDAVDVISCSSAGLLVEVCSDLLPGG